MTVTLSIEYVLNSCRAYGMVAEHGVVVVFHETHVWCIFSIIHIICMFINIVKVQDGWLVYSPMLIPRQFRFSLYSGAVITEGLM